VIPLRNNLELVEKLVGKYLTIMINIVIIILDIP
jgi:hypothetical protein